MEDRPRPRVVVIDDQTVIALGLAHPSQEVELVDAFTTVEDFLRAPPTPFDVILLDLQLEGSTKATTSPPIMGTAAIRCLLENGKGPVVVYTTLAEDMLLAACLAAGASGAVTKNAPVPTIGEVVRIAANGGMWVDPLVAGALRRYAERRHAGALSPQQANALRYRGQGLKQKAIADKIGVSDPEIVYRYLKAAVEKLADVEAETASEPSGKHPSALTDSVAHRSGLATGFVRWEDLQTRPSRRRRKGRR